MLGDDIREEAATHIEHRGQAHEARLRRFDEIIKNPVCVVFMEMTFLAKAPYVELQALQLDAGIVGNVVEDERGEIGLPGLGAKACVFRDFHVDMKVASRYKIGKDFQGFGG